MEKNKQTKQWEDFTPKERKSAKITFTIIGIVLVFLVFLIGGWISDNNSNSYENRRTREYEAYLERRKIEKENSQTSTYSQNIADTYGISTDKVDSVLDAMTNELNKGK